MSIGNYSHCYILIGLLSLVFGNSVRGQEKQYTGDVREVRVVSSCKEYSDVFKILIPHIVEWKPGYLVSAYEVGIPGKIDMGDIACKVSPDDGNTWSEEAVIFDHLTKHGQQRYGYANPVMFKVPGQNLLWCFAMRNPISNPNSQNASMVAAISGDGGRSWNHVELIMHYKGSLVLTGNVVQIKEPDGSEAFLLPAHCNTKNDDPIGGVRFHFVLKSKNLLEWELLSYIPQPEKVFLHEGHIAYGERDQELILVMRTANQQRRSLDPPRAWQSISSDNGKTWSSPEENMQLYNAVSEAAFGKTSQGAYFYIYNDGPDRGEGSRMALKYKLKYPGKEWSDEQTFFDAGVKNSYPSVIEVRPGDLRVVWDSGSSNETRNKIYFGKLVIPENNN